MRPSTKQSSEPKKRFCRTKQDESGSPWIQCLRLRGVPLSAARSGLGQSTTKVQADSEAERERRFHSRHRISHHADLATDIDATQEALASEGLVVMQWPGVSLDAKSMTLVNILATVRANGFRGDSVCRRLAGMDSRRKAAAVRLLRLGATATQPLLAVLLRMTMRTLLLAVERVRQPRK